MLLRFRAWKAASDSSSATRRIPLAGWMNSAANWWEQEVQFFDVPRSRAWVMVRRIAHTAHHRGQQMAMLRTFNRDLHSIYGPTADTGGLVQNGGKVIYASTGMDALLAAEARGGAKAPLPHPAPGPNPSAHKCRPIPVRYIGISSSVASFLNLN